MFSAGNIGAIGRGVSRQRLWTPLDLGSLVLVLWLDAADASTITLNESNVSQWSDKSIYGHHYVQGTEANQPLYLPTGLNGRPALENVSDDFLALGSSVLGRNVGGLTCAIVGSHPVGGGFATTSYDFLIASSLGATRFLLTANVGGATANRYSIGGRRLDSDTFATVSSSTDSLANRGNVWIRIGQRAYSNGVANHWTNGTQDITDAVVGTQEAGNASDTNSASSRIFQGGTGTPIGTKISQVVVTHSTMTNNDRQKLEGFLADRTNSRINLPANHPYRSAPPTV